MSYTPTEWRTGDVITADKLNKIEDALVGLSLLSDGTFKITKEGNDLEIIPVEAETNLENGVVTIKCTLSGTGTPSPSNVRDLNGFTEITISVENEDNSEETTTYSVDLPEDAGTVYGGTLDLTAGVLTVTHIKATYPTDNTVAKSNASSIPAGRHCYYVRVPNSAWSGGDENQRNLYFDCSIFPIENKNYVEMLTKTEFSMGIGSSKPYSSIGFNTDIDNLADFRTWLENANCQVVYPIATPIEYNLDPLIIKAMYDKNIVSTNAEKISVTFNCSIKTYIDEKTSDGSGI